MSDPDRRAHYDQFGTIHEQRGGHDSNDHGYHDSAFHGFEEFFQRSHGFFHNSDNRKNPEEAISRKLVTIGNMIETCQSILINKLFLSFPFSPPPTHPFI